MRPKNILIIRLSAIGDVLMASPLIGAFRRTLPGARISWLVEEPSRPILEGNPGLDEVIVWERSRWRRLFREKRLFRLTREIFSFIRYLRKKRFDMAVDAQGLLKSAIWAYLSGADHRIGVGSKEGSRYLMTNVVDRTGASDVISSQYRLLAEALDLAVGDFRMEMTLRPETERYARDIEGSLGSPYVVFCPFTTRPQKHWVDNRWKELAGRFRDETGFVVLLLGGPGDRVDSERIFGEGSELVRNFTGETTVQQAGGLIKNASLVIGVDTGLTHMGIALDTPTIALFGATRPYLNTAGTSGRVLYHRQECSPCRRSPTCNGEYTCMKEISVEEVFSAATAVLERE